MQAKVNNYDGMLARVSNYDGIDILCEPKYPGTKTGDMILYGRTVKYAGKEKCKWENNEITFYALLDGRGWIHNFVKNSTCPLHGITEIRPMDPPADTNRLHVELQPLIWDLNKIQWRGAKKDIELARNIMEAKRLEIRFAKEELACYKTFHVKFKSNERAPWGLAVNLDENWRFWQATEIDPGMQAHKLGIRENDKIVSIDNQAINDENHSTMKEILEFGDPCRVTLRRMKTKKYLQVENWLKSINLGHHAKKMADHHYVDLDQIKAFSRSSIDEMIETVGFGSYHRQKIYNSLNRLRPEVFVAKSDQSLLTDREEEIAKGVTGLENLQNTCYMDTSLICLFNMSGKFHEFFMDDKAKKQTDPNVCNKLSMEFGSLMQQFWCSGNQLIKHYGLKATIDRLGKEFIGFNPLDTRVFLTRFIKRLHDELNTGIRTGPIVEKREPEEGEQVPYVVGDILCEKYSRTNHRIIVNTPNGRITVAPQKIVPRSDSERKKAEEAWNAYTVENESIIVDTMKGLRRTEMICPTCRYIEVKYEPFDVISVPMPVFAEGPDRPKDCKITLMDCIYFYLYRKILTGIDPWHCPKCERFTPAYMKYDFWKLPEILLLHVKRFTSDEGYANRRRPETVHFNLDKVPVGQYSLNPKERKFVYKCIGVSNHKTQISSNGQKSGHYYTHARNMKNDKWYIFNDGSADEMFEKDVANSHSYLLYYKKIDMGGD